MARLIWTNATLAGVVILFAGIISSVNCLELDYTDITVIGRNDSYQTLNPNEKFDLFDKIRHVKGNIIFSKGKRITGDRLILNHFDSEKFSKPENILVLLRYPAVGDGQIITFIEVLAEPDSSSTGETAAFFENRGGISDQTFEMIIQCLKTAIFSYEIFVYGY